MDYKITIIEGPPPTFEEIQDGWAIGIDESPFLFDTVLTRLRTFNGPALVERCYSAWHNQAPIFLEYRNHLGLEDRALILAARNMDSPDGHVLLLWVRVEAEEISAETDEDDSSNEDYQ